jgi:hypothetical protein
VRTITSLIMRYHWLSPLLVLLLAHACKGYRFRWPVLTVQLHRTRATTSPVLRVAQTSELEAAQPSLLQPNLEDMNRLAYILANVTDHLDIAPETALTIASQEMGWLYQRNVPKYCRHARLLPSTIPTVPPTHRSFYNLCLTG